MPHPSSVPSPDGVRRGAASPDAVLPGGTRSDAGRPSSDDGRPGGVVSGAAAFGAELESVRQELAGLRAALESRATIDQARGILIARYRISPDGAFELLVRWSQDRNIKVRTIAETLVALAQYGVDGPEIDRSLGGWLAQQLTKAPPGE